MGGYETPMRAPCDSKLLVPIQQDLVPIYQVWDL